MSLDIAVYTVLDAAGVTNPGRGWKSESQPMPCAIVRYISDSPINSLKGEMNMQNEYIAVDCWADDLESAEAKRDAVIAVIKAAVAAKTLIAIRKATRPLHEPETTTFRFTIEYSVWG
ncbi:DUF3168 domain-containing protein [uncultured Amphritea sp.]|uniref:tail completion protein gp17 n=1 Tax=uncultured Amphritea sp. TaxID=981605 RepID=UPI00260514AD|nr:DUF3168 domain-containing protein [uncultured Amphritea sp.]